MIVLAAIGGSGASHGNRRSAQVRTAPISVAAVPKMMSSMAQPVSQLLSRQPIVSPGMAAGVKKGRMVSASDSLT